MRGEILLIEDDDSYRLSLKYLFDGEPYVFVEASSPEEGIAKLAENPQIRVILLDLSFGDGAGTSVLEHIKDRSDDYRVIVLTGHDELLAAEQAGEYDVFNYLPKAERSSDQAIRFSVDQAFKDLERKHLDHKLRFLLDVQRRINSNHDTKQTLDLICQSVRSTVSAYTCHIRVYDFNMGDYHLGGFAGPGEELRNLFDRPKARGHDFSGRIAESGKAESFPNLQSMAEFLRFKELNLSRRDITPEEVRYLHAVQSAYIVPISTGIFETAVDAVLNVSSESSGFFDANKCALVEEFVTQAALTITKEWLQQKRRELHQDYSEITKMLGDITDRLRGRKVLKGIYDVVTRRISEIVNPEVVSIFLYNEKSGRIENVAEFRGNEPVDTPDEFYEPGQSLTGAVFQGEKTILLPKPGESRRLKPLEDPRYGHQGKEGYLSIIPSGDLNHYLGVPIRMGGKVRGVLRAMNKKSKYYDETSAKLNRLCLLERGFSADCQNVMEITASHLAVAIRNEELLREKEHQVEHVSLLVSAVAHEINNTSGVIPANVKGIRAQLGRPNGNIERMLARIENAASQATEFANEIAGFSANQTGEKRAVDVNEVIQSAIDGLDLSKYRVPEAIALNVSFSNHPLVCEIYETPFAQIVRNIVINAFQALEAKQGGTVSVSSLRGSGESSGAAVIRFEDNGPGIMPEHKARIFDADFTTKAKGNGLGLWLVRTQLELVGGTIEVESEPGWGARFIVRIPLSKGQGDGLNEPTYTGAYRR